MAPLLVLAALSLRLTWTDLGDPCDSLAAYRCFDGRHESLRPALLWADPERTVPKRPRPSYGIPYADTAYMYLDPDWRSPIRVQLFRWWQGKVSGGSQDCIASMPRFAPVDTQYFLVRAPGIFTNPIYPNARGILSWSLPMGDTMPADIWAMRDVIEATKSRCCELFGRWQEAGEYRVCPGSLRRGRR